MEWEEWKCGGDGCDRILCELVISEGRIRKICDKCGTVNVFQARPPVPYEELLRHLLNRQATDDIDKPITLEVRDTESSPI